MLYNPKTKQVIIRRSYQTLHNNDQTISDQINKQNTLSQATIDTPDCVILPPTNVSGANAKSKNYVALPGQPYLFSTIQSESPPRRIKGDQQIYPTVMQS